MPTSCNFCGHHWAPYVMMSNHALRFCQRCHDTEDNLPMVAYRPVQRFER